MKHEKESDNIEKAEGAVDSYLRQVHGYGGSSRYDAPPPYFPQDPNTTPSAPSYNEFNNPNAEQQFGNCEGFYPQLYEHCNFRSQCLDYKCSYSCELDHKMILKKTNAIFCRFHV